MELEGPLPCVPVSQVIFIDSKSLDISNVVSFGMRAVVELVILSQGIGVLSV